jgi:hypothetical protein
VPQEEFETSGTRVSTLMSDDRLNLSVLTATRPDYNTRHGTTMHKPEMQEYELNSYSLVLNNIYIYIYIKEILELSDNL